MERVAVESHRFDANGGADGLLVSADQGAPRFAAHHLRAGGVHEGERVQGDSEPNVPGGLSGQVVGVRVLQSSQSGKIWEYIV